MAQLEANGIQLEVEDRGDASAPAILLIRGLGTQLVQWPQSFLAGLEREGFRTVSFDNRDVGLSQKLDRMGVPDFGELLRTLAVGGKVRVPYLIDDMAADCIGVLDELGIERAHLFGISMGGMIAQTVAARYPARTRSLISVMSTSGDPSLPQATPEAMAVLMSRPSDPTDRECVIEHGLVGRRVIGSPGHPDDDATIREVLGRAYDRCYYPEGVVRQMAAVRASGSRVALLREITAPTLVIHGSDDPLIPVEGGRDTARRIPGAALEVIEGMGHDLPGALVPRLVALTAEHAHKA